MQKAKSPKKNLKKKKSGSESPIQFLIFHQDEEEGMTEINMCDYGTKNKDIDDYKFKVRKDVPLKKLLSQLDLSVSEGDKLKIKKSELLVPKLFIRDILTKYVVQNIFENKSENKLIHIINSIMKSLYEAYKNQTGVQLMFVYRGGNILKLYKDNFENYLPGKVRTFFKKEFSDFFKVSDLDFYTVIKGSENMTKKGISKINKDIQMMCYYGCYVARIIICNNQSFFQFCKYNYKTLGFQFQKLVKDMNDEKSNATLKEVKQSKFLGVAFNHFFYDINDEILNKLLTAKHKINQFIPSIQEDDIIENLATFKKSGKFDINIKPKSDETEINKIDYNQPNLFQYNFNQEMKEIVEKNGIMDFYISCNRQIFNVEESIDFSLIRLMINFGIIYERDKKFGITNVPSELYDLSIGHPGDKMYKVYVSSNLTTYSFDYGDDQTDEIYIPTIKTTILDLINILYEYRDFPWLDTKYEKRLYRLLILSFIDQLTKKSIYNIKRDFKKILDKSIPIQSSKDFTELKTISFRYFEYKNKLIEKSLPKDSVEKFEAYQTLYYEIIEKLLHVIEEVEKFVKSQGKLGEEDISFKRG